jgi:hypothetical protein
MLLLPSPILCNSISLLFCCCCLGGWLSPHPTHKQTAPVSLKRWWVVHKIVLINRLSDYIRWIPQARLHAVKFSQRNIHERFNFWTWLALCAAFCACVGQIFYHDRVHSTCNQSSSEMLIKVCRICGHIKRRLGAEAKSLFSWPGGGGRQGLKMPFIDSSTPKKHLNLFCFLQDKILALVSANCVVPCNAECRVRKQQN